MSLPRLLTIFNAYLQKGGEEEAVARISDALRPRFDLRECIFSSARWKGERAPGALRQARLMLNNPESVAALLKIHREFQPEAWVIHNVFPVGSASIYPTAHRLRVPTIQYLHNFRPFSVNGYLWANGRLAPEGLKKNFLAEVRHGAWQDSRIKTAWFALVLRWMHARGWWKEVRAWIANSEFVRAKMIEAGLPESEVFTLSYPWVPQPLAPEPEGDHYLFLGRLIEAKGVRVLFETWKRLTQILGSGTPRLIIAGEGPLENWVKAQAKVFPSITFAGHLSGDAKKLALATARAVLAPSLWWEAFGLIAYEAYENEKLVLAARSGGLTENVIDGQTGYLHTPGDANQLAAQIAELEADAELRQTLGREGRRWLETTTDGARWSEKFALIFAHATR